MWSSPQRLGLFLCFLLFAVFMAQAQQGAGNGTQAPPRVDAPATAATDELDTVESLSYVGRKLWFEVRRRLNLTTAQEETEEKAREQQVKLRVGSIQVGREQAPAPARTAPVTP
jgi:hypothetical protein